MDRNLDEDPAVDPTPALQPSDTNALAPEGESLSAGDLNPDKDQGRADKVGGENRSIATRFKKGVCPNLNGRRGKPKKQASLAGTTDVLRSIDNEVVEAVFLGGRCRLPRAQALFAQFFERVFDEDLDAAIIIKDLAFKYFGAEAEAVHLNTVFVIMPDDCRSKKNSSHSEVAEPSALQNTKRKRGRPLKAPDGVREQFSTGYLFLRVAKWSVKVKRNGARAVSMSLWDAYLSKLYALAELPNYRAARLLNQLRKQFPGNALPSDPPVFIISEADAKL